jgi:esterase/lipase superfamily enzyme
MHVTRGVILATLIFGVAACAQRPHGFLIPSRQVAPGTSLVQMLVATTRAPNEAEPGEMFSGERGGQLSFAEITVSIPPDSARTPGEVQWPQSEVPDPTREFTTVEAQTYKKDG